MGDKTGISWTDATWSPARGCSRISEGCRNCYAERIAARFSKPGQAFHGFAQVVAPRDLLDRTGKRRDGWTRKVEFQPDQLAVPLRWKRPRRIFCSSMTDIFHEGLTNEEIAAVFGVMAACQQHTFQVLTKRAKRMREWFTWAGVLTLDHMRSFAVGAMKWANDAALVSRGTTWPLPNVWLGVSVENQDAADERIPELLRTPAAIRFLSCEPLLGQIDLSRWLGDVRQDQESRGVRLRSGDGWRDGDRRTGPYLENCETTRSEDGRNEINPVQTSARGALPRRVPEREGDGRLEAHDSAGAPDGLVPHQRCDSGQSYGEPQERGQGRQPARQPRVGDGLRAVASRDPRPQGRTRGEPTRDEESRGQAYDAASGGHSRGEITGGGADPDRGPVRDLDGSRVGYRTGQDAAFWIIGGCESGPSARPCDVSWLRSLRDQCLVAGIPFWLKQAAPAAGTMASGAPRPAPIDIGPGAKWKQGSVIELPYLDGFQYKEMPGG